MADSGISLRVQQYGAEGVKNRLKEILDQLKAGKPVTSELKTEVRELNTQVMTQEKVVKLTNRAWLEGHQTLLTTSRIMSSVGSIARSMLAITTAYSIATVAFGKNSSSIVEAESNLARAQRDLVAALQSGDNEKVANAQENVNKFTARVKELKDQNVQEQATSIINLGASMSLLGDGVLKAASKMGPLVTAMKAAIPTMYAFGAATWVALGPISLIILAIAGVAAALYILKTPGDTVQQIFDMIFPDAAKQAEDFGKVIDDVFTMHIPNAFIFMANTAIGVFNTVVSGAESMVNGVITGINSIIAAVNRVASFLKLPTVALIPIVSFAGAFAQPIPYATSRNWGAGGPGTYSGQVYSGGGGMSRGSGAGDKPLISITIIGDVSGDELVDKKIEQIRQNEKKQQTLDKELARLERQPETKESLIKTTDILQEKLDCTAEATAILAELDSMMSSALRNCLDLTDAEIEQMEPNDRQQLFLMLAQMQG